MQRKGKKRSLSRVKNQRDLLIRNLAIYLIEEEKITTTHAKAKVLQPFFDRMMTHAKKTTNSSKQQVQSLLNSEKAMKKAQTTLAKRYADRTSGYTRIIRMERRKGDNATQVIIELV